MNWYLMVWRKYATFQGRSRRKEFWMFILFNSIFILVLKSLGGVESLRTLAAFVYALYSLAIIIPTIALCVRRLHDTGRSGWMYLLGLIPIANLYLIYLFCKAGDPGANAYGANPKELPNPLAILKD